MIMTIEFRIEWLLGAIIAFSVLYLLTLYHIRTGRILRLLRTLALSGGGWIGALVGIFVVISYDLPGWIVLITIVLGAWIFDALMKRRGYRPFYL
ncbi:MAG: hypothetical protein CEE41_03180 [Hadesarchaea archaeon B3_Hades]|nr:MAG: hypothetical protein CEE41_03180 [Hadesarchaea archaeon B3_Hades]